MTGKDQDELRDFVVSIIEEFLPDMVKSLLPTLLKSIVNDALATYFRKFALTVVALLVVGISGYFTMLYNQNSAIKDIATATKNNTDAITDLNAHGTVYGRGKSEDYLKQINYVDKNVLRIMDRLNIPPVPKG